MHYISHIWGISIVDGVEIMKLRTKLAAVLGLLWATTGTVQAGTIGGENLESYLDTEIIGGSFFVVEDGNVFAQYVGSRAGYFNTLSFDGSNLFSQYSGPGTTRDLGYFSAGDELTFDLFVWQTGTTFHSGAGDNNVDGLAHFKAISVADGDGYLTSVGVEDQLGGGDLDFNDFMFTLTNVIDPPPGTEEPETTEPNAVSEPPALFLLAVGLVGLLARRRRAG